MKYLSNPYYLGDSVRLEPVASALDMGVLCSTPELFDHHPVVKAASRADSGLQVEVGEGVLGGFDWEGLKNLAGVEQLDSPRLYLSEDERKRSRTIQAGYTSPLIGLVHRSNDARRHYPYMKLLAKVLVRRGFSVIAFDKHYELAGVQNVVGADIRTLMTWLSAMHAVIGIDTGPMHIAAALNVPTVVIGRPEIQPLYGVYSSSTQVVSRFGMHMVSVRSVLRALSGSRPVLPSRKRIGVMRLDGVGGTLTVCDQLSKIRSRFPQAHITLIARKHGALFTGNPNVDEVIEVGQVPQPGDGIVQEYKDRYDAFCEQRFIAARWYQKEEMFQVPDEPRWDLFYDHHMDSLPEYEAGKWGMMTACDRFHALQTSYLMGLPHGKLDIQVYFDMPRMIDGDYVVVNSGTDTDHGGKTVTKGWPWWDQLVKLLPYPCVQVGTGLDKPILGARDFRGQTTLPELAGIVRHATHVVSVEGGVAHVGYAAKASKVTVLSGPSRGAFIEYPGHRHLTAAPCKPCAYQLLDWHLQCKEQVGAVCMKLLSPERVAHAVLAA